MDIFERIEGLVAERGWKKAEFMRRLGKDRTNYAKWKAINAIPSKHILQIARVLDTSEAYLRGETDDPFLPNTASLNELVVLRDPRFQKILQELKTMDDKGLLLVEGFIEGYNARKK